MIADPWIDWYPPMPLKAGDRFTVRVEHKRRWWELWRPFTWTEVLLFVATTRTAVLANYVNGFREHCGGEAPPVQLSEFGQPVERKMFS